jgi:universal stress protein E
VEWQEDWRGAIVAAAASGDFSLVVKTASRHSALGRRFLKTSDWTLLRECHCPTLLVSERSRWDRKVVLAAIKVDPKEASYDQLNQEVLAVARAISESAGLELHAVAASEGEALLDRQRFANAVGLPRSCVHGGAGTPHEVIAAAAGEVGAAVVVVGSPRESISREKLSKAHTAHWLIDHVDSDVFVVPAGLSAAG